MGRSRDRSGAGLCPALLRRLLTSDLPLRLRLPIGARLRQRGLHGDRPGRVPDDIELPLGIPVPQWDLPGGLQLPRVSRGRGLRYDPPRLHLVRRLAHQRGELGGQWNRWLDGRLERRIDGRIDRWLFWRSRRRLPHERYLDGLRAELLPDELQLPYRGPTSPDAGPLHRPGHRASLPTRNHRPHQEGIHAHTWLWD
jgi:hypothetical protein